LINIRSNNSYPALYPSVVLSNLFFRIADYNELQVMVIMNCFTDDPVIQVYEGNACHVPNGKHHPQSEDQANKNIIDAYITSYRKSTLIKRHVFIRLCTVNSFCI
jgi:hypothetical protein